MRISLARALFVAPDLLLLDEVRRYKTFKFIYFCSLPTTWTWKLVFGWKSTLRITTEFW